MRAFGFTPDRNYLYKRFMQVCLFAPIALCLTALGWRWIGHWIHPSGGASWGLIIGPSCMLVCLGFAMYLIYLDYRSLFYEIHQEEVIMHAGMMTRSVTHVPFQMIANLKILRDPLDRLLKLGTIEIQTTGAGDHHGARESLVGLKNFKEIYDLIAISIRQYHIPSPAAQENTGISLIEIETLKILLHEMKSIQHYLHDHAKHQNYPG